MTATTTANGKPPLSTADDLLKGNFKTADQVADSPPNAQGLSPQSVADAVKAIGQVAKGLAYLDMVQLLEPMAALIGALQETEREPAINQLYQILPNKDSVDNFLLKIPPPPGAPKFRPFDFAEFLALPPKQWLIEQVIGAGDLVMVYGAPGCGKTFVVIDLILAACLGRQWALRFDVVRPLNVAYCAGEGISGLPERFAAAAEYHGASNLSNFTFYAVTPQLYVGDDAIYTDSIKDFVQEWKERQNKGQTQPLDLLIIDTLHSATAGADENSAKDMGLVLRLAKDAANELGCAVVLIHHTNKAGTGERGSSALRGAMDCMIAIERLSENGAKAKIHCAKLKDGEAWKDQTFDLVQAAEVDSVRVWWDEPNDPVDGRKTATATDTLHILAEKPDRALTAKQLGDAIGKTAQAVNGAISRLERDELVKRTQNDRGTWVYTITEEGLLSIGVVDEALFKKHGL